MMAGIMIGGGIFGTPPDIARHLGSPLIAMAFWAAGGLLCLFGALAYAELATMFPRSGGIYVFLREAYGDGVAFIFGGLTRWAGLLCAANFAVAIAIVDRFAGIRGAFPAAALLLIGVYLATRGGGRYAFDAVIERQRRKR